MSSFSIASISSYYQILKVFFLPLEIKGFFSTRGEEGGESSDVNLDVSLLQVEKTNSSSVSLLELSSIISYTKAIAARVRVLFRPTRRLFLSYSIQASRRLILNQQKEFRRRFQRRFRQLILISFREARVDSRSTRKIKRFY